MTPVTAPTTVAPPPDHPVRTAVSDPVVESTLFTQAMASLHRWLADKPIEVRREEAREIVQTTRLRALEKVAGYDPARPVETWLHGLLANVLKEHCRKLRKVPTQPPAGTEGWDGVDRRLAHVDKDEAYAFLDRLPAADRRLVEWFYFDELSHRQIGERLRITEGAARLRFHRALAALKRSARAERREGRS